ncbi:5916_t:CDS:2, partial [Gigaspora margarita]
MDDTSNTIRQHKNREKESPEKRRERLSNDQYRRLKKKVAETNEEHEARLARDRERKHPGENIATISQSESFENVGAGSNLQQELKRPVIEVNIETIYPATENNDTSSQSENNEEIDVKLQLATTLSEYEKELLKKFRTKMNKLQYRCKCEKTLPKKFSAENNMNLGEVPEELQGLTEVEEMLIAQVFTVISVYKLCGGQHGEEANSAN